MQIAAVDGGHGDAVLIGVDAVVLRANGNIAAVDGQVQLGVQALVFSGDAQRAGTVDVHGHVGVDRAVLLPQLLFPFGVLVDFGDIGAGDGAPAVLCQNQISPGVGGIHGGLGGFRVPATVALIDVPEKNGGGDGAGDVRAVQNQLHHCVWVGRGVLAQVDANLPSAELAAETVSAGGGDVHHGVRLRLLGGVHVGFAARTVGVAAFVGGFFFVIDNIVGGIDRVGLPAAVYGQTVVGEGDDRLTVKAGGVDRRFGDGYGCGFRCGFRRGGGLHRSSGFHRGCRGGRAACQQQGGEQQRDDFLHSVPSFMGICS